MKHFVLAAVFAFALGAQPAVANEVMMTALGNDAPQEARARPVSYSDLNVAQAEDAALLMSRLRYAAMRVCEIKETEQLQPAARRNERTCRAESLASAVADVDSPALRQLHSGR